MDLKAVQFDLYSFFLLQALLIIYISIVATSSWLLLLCLLLLSAFPVRGRKSGSTVSTSSYAPHFFFFLPGSCLLSGLLPIPLVQRSYGSNIRKQTSVVKQGCSTGWPHYKKTKDKTLGLLHLRWDCSFKLPSQCEEAPNLSFSLFNVT